MGSTFKKGDSVFCSDYGTGYVIDVSQDIEDRYPIKVEFRSDNSVVWYMRDGRSLESGGITLQHYSHDWQP